MPYAVITGATQGIGKAIAEKFLKQGYSIAVCARTQSDLNILQKVWQLEHPKSEILAVHADLAHKEQAIAFGRRVLETFPAVDVLVNNAGLFFPGKLATEPDGHLETLMNVNLFSAYHLTRLLLPVMQQAKSGHIFNMCSVASLKAYENGGAYSITKYALQGFSENLRHELMEDRIKVTSIFPGATWSRSWAGSGLPEGRFMKAEDIAEMVWTTSQLSSSANVDTIVLRPIEGDI